MEHHIDSREAAAQLGQLLGDVTATNDRYVIARNGRPAALLISVGDYLRNMRPPGWLERSWTNAERLGLDTMTADEIDAEIAASRQVTRAD